MPGKKTGDTPPPRRRYSKGRAIATELEPEWKSWFERIERLRKDVEKRKHRTVASEVERNGEKTTIFRKKSAPETIKAILRADAKKTGRNLSADICALEAAWRRSVGDDIAGESAVFSFKNGILTISVFSTSLLQELRQFHHEPVTRDLRDIWPLEMPLVKLLFKPGKRKK